MITLNFEVYKKQFVWDLGIPNPKSSCLQTSKHTPRDNVLCCSYSTPLLSIKDAFAHKTVDCYLAFSRTRRIWSGSRLQSPTQWGMQSGEPVGALDAVPDAVPGLVGRPLAPPDPQLGLARPSAAREPPAEVWGPGIPNNPRDFNAHQGGASDSVACALPAR
jgi:hypothetical protein